MCQVKDYLIVWVLLPTSDTADPLPFVNEIEDIFSKVLARAGRTTHAVSVIPIKLIQIGPCNLPKISCEDVRAKLFLNQIQDVAVKK